MSDVPTATTPTRVFLVDDHEVVRRGLRDLLGDEPDLEVVGDASTAEQALTRGPAVRPEDELLALLSERERSVLDLIGEGLINRQIAKRLYLSEKTVKNHISRLLGKLGVERRVQAAVIAAQTHDHDTEEK